MLKRVEADLLDYAVVEQFPKMEGRQMVMVLQPHKNPKAKSKANELSGIKQTLALKAAESVYNKTKEGYSVWTTGWLFDFKWDKLDLLMLLLPVDLVIQQHLIQLLILI